MKTSSLIYMILICGLIWGGFFICVWLDLKNHNKAESPEPRAEGGS